MVVHGIEDGFPASARNGVPRVAGDAVAQEQPMLWAMRSRSGDVGKR
jgi:hypothetical protein